MDKEHTTSETPLQAVGLDEALLQIQAKPKRQYTQQEIDKARDNLALMNDRVFLVTFMDNKNNHIIKGLADSVRPDVIGINILGFRLPQLEHRKEFVSRIVRAEFDSNEPFLAEKYSDYYIELPKMDDWKKNDLPEAYHDLWDLCCIFKAKIREHEEVIRMQAIRNPIALDLSKEARKTIVPNDFVNTTLSREQELAELREYGILLTQKSIAEGIAKGEAIGEARGEAKAKEEMIIMALQNDAPYELVDIMRTKAGITDARFAELQVQAQHAS